MTTETILEEFAGFVDHIDGETAFVSLQSQSGAELSGKYSAQELAEFGIQEHRRFKCRTVEIDGKVEVQFEAIPDIELTLAEEQSIDREIDELVAE